MLTFEDFLARNMTITEFAGETGIAVSTLRDWNKRDMAKGIGQPADNGHWRYSRSDGLAVREAKRLSKAGYQWEDALAMGSAIRDYLVGRFLYPDQAASPSQGLYGARFLVFYPHPTYRVMFFATDDLSAEISDYIKGYDETGRQAPVYWVIDLHNRFSNLPGDRREQPRQASLRRWPR